MLDALALNFAATSAITLAPPRSLVSIAAFHGATAPLSAALGVALPTTPVSITQDDTTYLWSGPDRWLAMSQTPDLETKTRAAAANLAAITDQSDSRAIFRVTDPAVLQKLIPIDLHETVFGPNATALTLAGHLAVQLWRTDDGAYEIACFRSFAAALYDSLAQAENPGRG